MGYNLVSCIRCSILQSNGIYVMLEMQGNLIKGNLMLCNVMRCNVM